MERERQPVTRGEDEKQEKEIQVSELDKIGFGFVEMTYSDKFEIFLKWLSQIRAELNRVDRVFPELNIDPSKNMVENFGLKSLTMRAKVSMLDDIVLMVKSVQTKFEKIHAKEKNNG